MNYADAAITFKTTDVILEDGKATIKGYFYNDGDIGEYVKELIVRNIIITDYDDASFIWAMSSVNFNKVGGNPMRIYVAPGEYATGWEFYYWNPDIPQRSNFNYHAYYTVVYGR